MYMDEVTRFKELLFEACNLRGIRDFAAQEMRFRDQKKVKRSCYVGIEKIRWIIKAQEST